MMVFTEEQARAEAKYYVTVHLTRSSMEDECRRRGLKVSKSLCIMEEQLIEAMAQELLHPQRKNKVRL